jgi:hypothetical protein
MIWILQVVYLLWHGWRPRRMFGRWRWSCDAHALQTRSSAVLRQRGNWPGPRLLGPRPSRGAGQYRCPSCHASIQARRTQVSVHVVGKVIWCPACKQPATPREWSRL